MAEDKNMGVSETPWRPLPSTLFTLDDVAAPHRYDLWRDSISCIFEVEVERAVRRDGFFASVNANLFGPMMLARTRTNAHRWRRSPAIMSRDGMDHYMIQYFESGEMFCDAPSGDRHLPKKSLVVFDLSRPAYTRTSDFQNLSLIIPRNMLEHMLAQPDEQHMRILDASEPMARLLRDHMLSLKNVANRLNFQQSVDIAPTTAGLVAACLNSTVNRDVANQRLGVGIAQLTIIRREIESNLAQPGLSVAWLARQVGASRSSLYRLFEPFGGVAAYIRERRLRQAFLTLSDSRSNDRPIYDIALAAGYANDTAFSKAFRARYGAAPRDVRGKKGPISSLQTESSAIDRRYERWLHHLSM